MGSKNHKSGNAVKSTFLFVINGPIHVRPQHVENSIFKRSFFEITNIYFSENY